MSQSTQPKNSAHISKTLAEYQKTKAAAELKKLKKIQDDQSRAERLQKRKLTLPASTSTSTPQPAEKSTTKTQIIRTPSQSPADTTHFNFHVTPTLDVKFDVQQNETHDNTNEPFDISINESRKHSDEEQPIKIVIDQPDTDSDVDRDFDEVDDKDVIDRNSDEFRRKK